MYACLPRSPPLPADKPTQTFCLFLKYQDSSSSSIQHTLCLTDAYGCNSLLIKRKLLKLQRMVDSIISKNVQLPSSAHLATSLRILGTMHAPVSIPWCTRIGYMHTLGSMILRFTPLSSTPLGSTPLVSTHLGTTQFGSVHLSILTLNTDYKSSEPLKIPFYVLVCNSINIGSTYMGYPPEIQLTVWKSHWTKTKRKYLWCAILLTSTARNLGLTRHTWRNE